MLHVCGRLTKPPSFFASLPLALAATMERLAIVELQIIMQQMECKELLAFARCNSKLMHVAESPFAWRHATLRLNLAQTTAAGATAPSRLLRHARTFVHWTSSSFPLPSAAIDALQASNLSLHELDASGCARIEPLQWARILALPQAQHLRLVRLHQMRIQGEEGVVDMIRALVALPRLHTLRLMHLADARLWSPLLPSAPALTSLDIGDSFLPEESVMMDVAKCDELKHLALHSPSLYGERFLAFFTSPSIMRALESLSLHSFFCGPVPFAGCASVPPVDYAAAFASLRSLHTLTLGRCFGLDLLLPHLAALSSLRQLRIDFSPPPLGMSNHLALPSVSVILQLLTASTDLRCTITVLPAFPPPDGAAGMAPAAPQKSPAEYEVGFAPVQAAVGGARFSLLFPVMP
jgi:hypothetical protein